MTTHYTSTVDITTPSVSLFDFTCVVPPGLGVNVYGGAVDANISNFDVGPTGDTNILLQTLASGGHHVHGGVCHDSAHGTVPPYGVHGIYDKAAGSLIDTIEFYNHPNGDGYSPRYANRCKSCVFHDTPQAIGLFNYQGTALGSGGTLRIRDGIFYNIPVGGWVFFSDGDWRATDGTVLGPSLISVEIDHATIDVRGVTQPFPFQDCHNDVYLTNSIIISDSGLPLSSIITPPTDGSTVHLDGSIVLSSADAATYLGAAPTFIPIAVGGSPIIGLAVASPPGCYAEWGNEGDVGATQTGSTPPGPPPLPGPAIPTATSLGLVGSAVAFGTNTVVIPVGITIPRSDPTGGATIIVVTVICDDSISPSGPFAIVDDAPTDPFYGTCLVTSGLNSYVGAPWEVGIGTADGSPRIDGGWMGLITNPLDASNSITVTAGSVQDYLFAYAVAYTGVSVDYVGPGGFTDAAGVFAASPDPPLGLAGCGMSLHEGVAWSYGSGFSLDAPSGCATPTSWEWFSAGIAVYMLWSSRINTPPTGPNTWVDPDIVTLDEFDDVSTGVGPSSYSFVYAEQAISAGETGIDLSSSWLNPGGLNQALTLGGGSLLVAGPGPTCAVSPPGGGNPIFNNHLRLSE